MIFLLILILDSIFQRVFLRTVSNAALKPMNLKCTVTLGLRLHQQFVVQCILCQLFFCLGGTFIGFLR